jgi:hypothetical protein
MNHALDNVPADRCRFHICWGNYEGPHDFDIGIDKILPIILNAKPQAILFEAANARHEHEWQAWQDANIPDDKILVPGTIDTCTNLIEHPELVAQRIDRFARIVGRERLIPTAASVRSRDTGASTKKLLTESSNRSSKAPPSRAAGPEHIAIFRAAILANPNPAFLLPFNNIEKRAIGYPRLETRPNWHESSFCIFAIRAT